MANKNKIRKSKACAQRKHKHTSNNKTVQSGGLKITTGFIEMGWYETIPDPDSSCAAIFDLLEDPLSKRSLIRIALEKQTGKWFIVDVNRHIIIPTSFTEDQIEQAQDRAEMMYIINRSREA